MSSLHKAWLDLRGAVTAKDDTTLGQGLNPKPAHADVAYDNLFDSQEEYEQEVKEVAELIRSGFIQPREPDTDNLATQPERLIIKE